MVKIELSPEEARFLLDFLSADFTELRSEIRKTDKQNYRLTLLEQEDALKDMIQKVENAIAEAGY